VTHSNSRTAYSDCFDLYDRALGTDRGVRYICEFENQAVHFRSRMNKARELDRKINREIYHDQTDHPLFGRSEYDIFTVKVRRDFERDKWMVLVERLVLSETRIEEIPSDEIEEDLEEELENEGDD
jgi:hypothetical protein